MREAIAQYIDNRAPITSSSECGRISRLWRMGQTCVVSVNPISNREICYRLGIKGPASVFGVIDDPMYHDFAMDVTIAGCPTRIAGKMLADAQRNPPPDAWWMCGLGLDQEFLERHFGC